jgi:hypothetical protein
MEKKVKTLKEKMKRDLETETKSKDSTAVHEGKFSNAHTKVYHSSFIQPSAVLMKMKVSFPMHIQKYTTHSFNPVLFSFPQTPHPKFISCILGTIILFILHLNYQKLH